VRLKVKEVCRACEGTGIAPTGRVRCPACGGYGHSWVSKPETAAAADKDPKPLTGKTPVDAAEDAFAEATGGRFDRTVKVWSKERKDFVVAVE
jgi:RecJ-like exonuclease